MRNVRWLGGFGVFILFSAICAISLRVESAEHAQQGATPLALWVVGDDGVTQQLAADIRGEIAKRGDLVITDDANSIVRLEIPTNVEVQEVASGYGVHYVVLFLDAESRYLGGSFGGCRESEIYKCANRVVYDLRIILKDLPEGTKKGKIKEN